MSSDVAITARDVSKHYLMFERPEDRLKQMIVPRIERALGRPPRRYYRDFAALRGVSFEVRRGETVGVVGRNGCGKSTLLQIVCGTLRPTSGTVAVNGRIAALLELGAGFNPEFTGRENVYLNSAILGRSRTHTDARFDDIARFADIGPFIDQPVKTYSSGMYVRLAFATAINVDPDILVVDEALAVGDEAFQRKCFARIEEIKDRGGTILFVSHGAQTIVQLCDRALLIDRGELILEGRPKSVVGQYQRLVNASNEAAAQIRASILEMRDAPPVPDAAERGTAVEAPAAPVLVTVEAGVGAAAVATVPASTEPPPRAPADAPADYCDPSLVSKSTVYQEERGARIRDVRITTIDGKPVNVLRMGRRYVHEFAIDFSAPARGVIINNGFRTVQGQLIAGGASHPVGSHKGLDIAKGATVLARFTFRCQFLPGVYFCNARVVGLVQNEFAVMHRIADAIAFRVSPELNLTALGVVDLDIVSEFDVR